MGVDSNLIRLLWILFTLFYGIGVLMYIAAWIIIPEEPGGVVVEPLPRLREVNWPLLVGVVLVVLGVIVVLGSFQRLLMHYLRPLLLLLVGAVLVVIGLGYGRTRKK